MGGGGGNMGGGGGGFGGNMGNNGMGPGMGNGGMQIDQANLNNLMGTLLSNLERNIIQRQTMGGGGGGYRDRVPQHRMVDRDRRDRGPLRGVSKTDRGGIRRDRFQPKFSTRDRDTHKKTTTSRDAKSRTDKEKRSTDSKKRESAKKDDDKKEKKDEEKKEEGAEAKKDGAEKSDAKADGETSKAKDSTEAYCTVCEKFFTGDLVDHRRSSTHKVCSRMIETKRGFSLPLTLSLSLFLDFFLSPTHLGISYPTSIQYPCAVFSSFGSFLRHKTDFRMRQSRGENHCAQERNEGVESAE